ncbi:hypothetical protein HanPI659440_Chr02g0043531 [Helianthus annuus]|nr:hypothetical protein HanPI659440_Chr02g0043531 [Helianthus annuus]
MRQRDIGKVGRVVGGLQAAVAGEQGRRRQGAMRGGVWLVKSRATIFKLSCRCKVVSFVFDYLETIIDSLTDYFFKGSLIIIFLVYCWFNLLPCLKRKLIDQSKDPEVNDGLFNGIICVCFF